MKLHESDLTAQKVPRGLAGTSAVQISGLGGGVWNAGSCGERRAKENISNVLSIISAAIELEIIGKVTADPQNAQWQIATASVLELPSGRLVLVVITCGPEPTDTST